MDVMEILIHVAGFAGAWLLVAGPLLQGAIELRDECRALLVVPLCRRCDAIGTDVLHQSRFSIGL